MVRKVPHLCTPYTRDGKVLFYFLSKEGAYLGGVVGKVPHLCISYTMDGKVLFYFLSNEGAYLGGVVAKSTTPLHPLH